MNTLNYTNKGNDIQAWAKFNYIERERDAKAQINRDHHEAIVMALMMSGRALSGKNTAERDAIIGKLCGLVRRLQDNEIDILAAEYAAMDILDRCDRTRKPKWNNICKGLGQLLAKGMNREQFLYTVLQDTVYLNFANN
jgi:hypothetical protein